MLKNFGYGGTYRDGNISVGVLLENPLDYGIDVKELVFSVTVKSKDGDTPKLEDFTFSVMDESNRSYDTQTTPCLKTTNEAASEDDEPLFKPDGLIITDFKQEFLFQDLRISFCYRPYEKTTLLN